MQRGQLVFPFLQLPEEVQEYILLRLSDADVSKLVAVAQANRQVQTDVSFTQARRNAYDAARCQPTAHHTKGTSIANASLLLMQELAAPSWPPFRPAGCAALSCVVQANSCPGEQLSCKAPSRYQNHLCHMHCIWFSSYAMHLSMSGCWLIVGVYYSRGNHHSAARFLQTKTCGIEAAHCLPVSPAGFSAAKCQSGPALLGQG